MNKKLKVFFDASVILAGLKSPGGGSKKLLNWVRKGKIKGSISELVFYEVLKHSKKIGLSEKRCRKEVINTFGKNVYPAPDKITAKYRKIIIDEGDIHLLESSKILKVDYLVSLDKKHILSLKNSVKDSKIVSPGELILNKI